MGTTIITLAHRLLSRTRLLTRHLAITSRTMSTFPAVTLNDGHKIPGVGYGCGAAWYAAKPDESGANRPLVEAIKSAIKLGFSHIDGAEMYANEESVGVAIAESGVARKDLFVTTKVGSGISNIPAALEASLKKMKLDYVDLYLIHKPTHAEAWKVMEELQAKGLCKSIGVSNYRLSDLEKTLPSAKVIPAVNQIEFHPYVYNKALPLQEFCKEKGIIIEAYGPTSPVTKKTGGPVDPLTAKIAESMSKTTGDKVEPSQVLLKLAQQMGAIVITTSGKEFRMKEQLAVGSLPEIEAADVKALVEAGKSSHQRVF